ncbi:hypothetical protein J3F83DRAFT_741714 [Trichoderma novae-zelandiae]
MLVLRLRRAGWMLVFCFGIRFPLTDSVSPFVTLKNCSLLHQSKSRTQSVDILVSMAVLDLGIWGASGGGWLLWLIRQMHGGGPRPRGRSQYLGQS